MGKFEYTYTMIRNVEAWEAWEREYVRSTPIDIAANFKTFQSMLEMASALGDFPPKNPLEGIEHKIELAEAINRVGTPYSNRG